MSDPTYTVLDVDLSDIRNTTEERVARQLQQELELQPDFTPSEVHVKDMYALALNLLPARYVQYGTIEMSGKVPDTDIARAVTTAIQRVKDRPRPE